MFYNDNVKMRIRVNFRYIDANTYYLKHYQISLLLRATMHNATNFRHKAIANEQLIIAERKISFFERHKNFDLSQILNDVIRLKKMNMSQVCIAL